MNRRLLCLIVALTLIAAGCASPATPEATPDPLTLVSTAAVNIRDTESFKMLVERTGAPYFVETDLGNVAVRRVAAQYVAPEVLQATVRLIAAGLPTQVDVFSRGENQWYRHEILTASRWFNAPFSPGFNPEKLIAQDTGFQAALRAMIGLNYIGVETIESGVRTHHLTATANGPDVTALMMGLVYMSGLVNVDIYIDAALLIPVRFVIEQPDTITEAEPEPTTWIIDIYDINGAAEIEDPEGTATAESTTTAEATAAE